jgi:hypothetical protein
MGISGGQIFDHAGPAITSLRIGDEMEGERDPVGGGVRFSGIPAMASLSH